MKRALVLLLFIIAVRAHAQCLPYSTGSGSAPDYLYIQHNAAMRGVSQYATQNATSMWRSCWSYGQQMGFSIPTNTPPSGASYASITVRYNTGYHPTNPSACGRFTGQYVDVYQYANNPSGQQVQCSSFGWEYLIAHEIGHFYRHGDVFGSGCPTIMGQADGGFHSVTGDDCAVAKNANTTTTEYYPVNPMCQQPCAGSCNMDGSCTATTPTSPLILSFGGGFALSGLEDPVSFDIANEGRKRPTGWTARHGDAAFLALDLDGNGAIDDGGELFGDNTLQADGRRATNGFDALAQYDANEDFVIDAADAVWPRLRLWRDADHDGVTDAGELSTLDSHGIVSLGLTYALGRRTDPFGNVFGIHGLGTRRAPRGRGTLPFAVFDVYFVRGQ